MTTAVRPERSCVSLMLRVLLRRLSPELPCSHFCALCELMQEEGAAVPRERSIPRRDPWRGGHRPVLRRGVRGRGRAVTLAEPDAARREAAAAGARRAAATPSRWRGSRGMAGGSVTVVPSDATRRVRRRGPRDRVRAGDGSRRSGRSSPGFWPLARPETVLATASSAITMSRIVPDAAQQARCLVAHPVNPPAVLRVIELVPAPGTLPATLDAGGGAVRGRGLRGGDARPRDRGLRAEPPAGAVLREAYRLVDEGVTDVAGIEAACGWASGPRWALSGPFETAELNTPGGIVAHAARMGPAYSADGRGAGRDGGLAARPRGARRGGAAARSLPEDAAGAGRVADAGGGAARGGAGPASGGCG